MGSFHLIWLVERGFRFSNCIFRNCQNWGNIRTCLGPFPCKMVSAVDTRDMQLPRKSVVINLFNELCLQGRIFPYYFFSVLDSVGLKWDKNTCHGYKLMSPANCCDVMWYDTHLFYMVHSMGSGDLAMWEWISNFILYIRIFTHAGTQDNSWCLVTVSRRNYAQRLFGCFLFSLLMVILCIYIHIYYPFCYHYHHYYYWELTGFR